MGSRKWIESFGDGAGTKQMSPKARIEHSGTSGVLSWSLMILSSQPAGRGMLCMLEPCEILAIAVL